MADAPDTIEDSKTPPSDQAEVLRAALRSVTEVAGRLIQEARHHHRGRGSELVGTSQGDLRYLPRLLPLLRELETETTTAAEVIKHGSAAGVGVVVGGVPGGGAGAADAEARKEPALLPEGGGAVQG